MRVALLTIPILLCQSGFGADEVSKIHAYVDTDICARLMLGPITPERRACSEKMGKDQDEPLLVRLSDNMVLAVNKRKMIENMVGQLVEASGTMKVKAGTIKLQDVKAIEPGAIPAGPERKLLERGPRNEPDPKVWEKVRHELAMMPYISEFDFISFTMMGSDVILTGWTVRQTNRDTAFNLVKDIPGVGTVVNNIDILPLGTFDMQIRAGARAALQMNLSRYFWGNGSDIKIIVKNGQILLVGTVSTQTDSDLATMRCNQVRGAFKVFNLLRVANPPKEKGQAAASQEKTASGAE
ncbi:MAG TPA: BON domain-containing protein [Bryobacteraceae bacterium]|nr:BON domain-containing protein [Bryobacteraceae bacterium]